MRSRRYALLGGLLGLGFPILQTFVEALTRHATRPLLEALLLAQGSPLLWAADMVPLVLLLAGGLVGRRQDEVQALEAADRARFEATASELSRSARTLHAAVSSFSAMTVQTASSVAQTTGTMQEIGQTATKAALTAETVVGLATRSRSALGEVQRAVNSPAPHLQKLAAALDEARSASAAIAQMAVQQDHGIDAVLRSMNEIYLATQELSTSTQSVAGQAQALSSLAEALARPPASA